MPSPFTMPVAKSIPFDNASNDFSSSNLQSAVEEVRAIVLPPDLIDFNFTVPAHRQMIAFQRVTVSGGRLSVYGRLVIL